MAIVRFYMLFFVLGSNCLRQTISVKPDEATYLTCLTLFSSFFFLIATGAPSRAQINYASRRPRLFDGCHIFLKGLFDKPYPSKMELTNLLKSGGATILRREPDPESIPPEEQRLPYHVEPESALSKCSHFIIYQEGPKEPILKYDMSHCKSLPLAWLLECIKNFALIPPFKWWKLIGSKKMKNLLLPFQNCQNDGATRRIWVRFWSGWRKLWRLYGWRRSNGNIFLSIFVCYFFHIVFVFISLSYILIL